MTTESARESASRYSMMVMKVAMSRPADEPDLSIQFSDDDLRVWKKAMEKKGKFAIAEGRWMERNEGR